MVLPFDYPKELYYIAKNYGKIYGASHQTHWIWMVDFGLDMSFNLFSRLTVVIKVSHALIFCFFFSFLLLRWYFLGLTLRYLKIKRTTHPSCCLKFLIVKIDNFHSQNLCYLFSVIKSFFVLSDVISECPLASFYNIAGGRSKSILVSERTTDTTNRVWRWGRC